MTLPDDSVLPYDYLVIAPDFADQSLLPLGAEAVGVTGAFSVIDEEAESAAVAFLDSQHTPVPVIVYGASLNAYCAIQAVLSRGVLPAAVTFVQPTSTAGDYFCDPRVHTKVHQVLDSIGVQVCVC